MANGNAFTTIAVGLTTTVVGALLLRALAGSGKDGEPEMEFEIGDLVHLGGTEVVWEITDARFTGEFTEWEYFIMPAFGDPGTPGWVLESALTLANVGPPQVFSLREFVTAPFNSTCSTEPDNVGVWVVDDIREDMDPGGTWEYFLRMVQVGAFGHWEKEANMQSEPGYEPPGPEKLYSNGDLVTLFGISGIWRIHSFRISKLSSGQITWVYDLTDDTTGNSLCNIPSDQIDQVVG